MSGKYLDFIIVNALSLILGGICINIYVSFVGFSFAFLMEQELYRKFMYIFGHFGEMRVFLFNIYNFIQDTVFMVIVLIPFLYWFSRKISKYIPFCLVSFLIGAIIGDYLLVISYDMEIPDMAPDLILSYSIFFDNPILGYIQNLGVWGSVFFVSILIGSKLKEKSDISRQVT